MRFGSEEQRSFRQGECRTTNDVRLLFERYRAEARHYEALMGEHEQRTLETVDAGGGTRTPTALATET
jgi:hypothetical protein